MEAVRLQLDNLGYLDTARLEEEFAECIARCVQDCEKRPCMPTTRSVALVFNLKPMVDESGMLTGVSVSTKMQAYTPAYGSRPTVMHPNSDGSLKFVSYGISSEPSDLDDYDAEADLGDDGDVPA